MMEVLRSAWLFFQNQVLGMRWLNVVIGNGLSAGKVLKAADVENLIRKQGV